MEKSENYYRRQELLEKLQVPTMSEVAVQLGGKLSKVVFQECPQALKKDLGLEPKLKGPGPVLWTSPSDLLIGKVCLKPPLTDKHIKALTHEGIIAIGNDIELKFWNEMELEKKRALDKQAEYLKTIAERVLRVAVKMARNEEREECARQFDIVSKEFEEKLKYELDQLEQDMLQHQRLMVKAAVAAVEEEWNARLQASVEDTVKELTKQFLNDLEEQKHKLENVFRAEFEMQTTQYDLAINLEHEACQTTMQQLRHCLECKNLANLMYVLCMERRKCCIERSVLEYKHKLKVHELNETIIEKDELITKLTDECDKKQKQVDVREKCVLEILKQFQKFINYALRATPTQAEFLLDVKKMMLFELAQKMVQINKHKAPHLAREILPWKSDSMSTSVENESSKLTLSDYHECLDEVIPPSAQSDFLPSFYYNDKLYVNQDLRIMAAKDMEISETNVLWNKDVEHMIRILKTSVDKGTTTNEDEQKSLTSGEISEEEISNHYIQNMSSRLEEPNAEKSNLSFESTSRKSTLKNSIEKVDQAVVYCTLSGTKDAQHTESKETSEFLKKILKTSMEIEIAPIDTTGLLATKDSLIKIRESRRSSMRSFKVEEAETNNMLMAVRKSLETRVQETSKATSGEGSVNFENLDAIRIPDQLEIKKCSKSSKASIQKSGKASTGLLKDPILHETKTPVPRPNSSRESKLLSTKDSLIIHRNSVVPQLLAASLRRRSIQTEEQIQISNSDNYRRASTISKLSVTRDSLELIRKQSALSKLSKARSNSSSPISMENPQPKPKEEQQPDLIEYESLERRVSPFTEAHVELAKLPTVVAETSVNFSPIKEVYEINVMKTSDSPWRIYDSEEKEPSRDNFITKPNEVRISGDQQSKEHIEGSPSFTVNRINSILEILKEDPSLMRLFTSCTK